uniref:Alkaline phosphatase n=1 Tax=Symbiodinium sp. CCMA192 TaxID=1503985 RepID=A0A0M3LA14_9DINO|nr:alkaline phosphatase [Symbiodinium sp. CCMA192]
MLVLLATLALAAARPRQLGGTPSMDTAADYSAPSSFAMVSRVYIPYDTEATSLAFGMGAAEQIAYDHMQKYAYAVSEQGVLNVIDWNDPSNPAVQSSLAYDFQGEKLTDIEICADKRVIFVGAGASTKTDNGRVHILSTVQRSSPAAPTSIGNLEAGPLPDMILPNSDCTKLAVANEGEAIYKNGLTDPAGSAMIFESSDWSNVANVVKHTVTFDSYTDSQLIQNGVHLPLSYDAMVYWDDNSYVASTVDFASARSSYSAATNLEPEYLAWSGDDSTLFVNLQENNAVAIINVPSTGFPSLTKITGLGLKDYTTIPIDLKKDQACTLATYAGLKSLRLPDSIQAVEVDGKTYLLTANEGDDVSYGDWEEKMKLKDVVESDGTPDKDMINMTITAAAASAAQAVHTATDGLRITIGSTAVDYSDPLAPEIQHIVAFGGRGISIYEHTGGDLSLTWDSGSEFEAQQCAHFPWAHNGIQDEEFSPVNGTLWTTDAGIRGTLEEMAQECNDGGDGKPGACPLGQTVDERSEKDGPAPEAIVAGKACGSLLAVTATEKQSTIFVYDISNINSPTLLFVKHLSPSSETKNPGVAYADRSLGETDPEAMIFLDAAHSPSGKAGVMVGGAWSGTMSFWEFECPSTTTSVSDVSTAMSALSGWSLTILVLVSFALA